MIDLGNNNKTTSQRKLQYKFSSIQLKYLFQTQGPYRRNKTENRKKSFCKTERFLKDVNLIGLHVQVGYHTQV